MPIEWGSRPLPAFEFALANSQNAFKQHDKATLLKIVDDEFKDRLRATKEESDEFAKDALLTVVTFAFGTVIGPMIMNKILDDD